MSVIGVDMGNIVCSQMDFVNTLLFRKKFTGDDFIIQNQISRNDVTLFADFPYIKGNADTEKIILFSILPLKKYLMYVVCLLYSCNLYS